MQAVYSTDPKVILQVIVPKKIVLNSLYPVYKSDKDSKQLLDCNEDNINNDCLEVAYKIYKVPSISFQTFFVQAFKIVIDSWKFSMLLLYILWDGWPIFMIPALNEQL